VAPLGHHSLNSTCGDPNGEAFVARLRQVQFSERWVIRISYQLVQKDDGGLEIQRSIEGANRSEFEGQHFDTVEMSL
jgi:hypothetical protein